MTVTDKAFDGKHIAGSPMPRRFSRHGKAKCAYSPPRACPANGLPLNRTIKTRLSIADRDCCCREDRGGPQAQVSQLTSQTVVIGKISQVTPLYQFRRRLGAQLAVWGCYAS